MAIYLCGVLAGVAFGYLILSTTFAAGSPLRPSSVHIWGFRGPLGAFIASWGGITMLTSAPFDNWWHDAYGLDVKIVSPPHMVLFVGTYAVLFGTLVLIAGHVNRVTGAAQKQARGLFLYVAGITLIMFMVLIQEFTGRSLLHSFIAYLPMAILVPMALGIGSHASGMRFGGTVVAAVYMLAMIGFILILPLFPAEPKLGPVYQHVSQFIPPQFPILLIAPSLALDLLWPRMQRWNAWGVAAVSALVFLGVLLIVEWPFAEFLMSPLARNRFFGTMYLYYGAPPTSYYARYLFYDGESARQFWQGMALALVATLLSFRIGFSGGDWMRAVKR